MAVVNDATRIANAVRCLHAGRRLFLYEADITAGAYTPIKWQRIPGFGRTCPEWKHACHGPVQTPGGSTQAGVIGIFADTGRFNVYAYFSPTLNFAGRDLRYGISLDDETPQIIALQVNSSQKVWQNFS